MKVEDWSVHNLQTWKEILPPYLPFLFLHHLFELPIHQVKVLLMMQFHELTNDNLNFSECKFWRYFKKIWRYTYAMAAHSITSNRQSRISINERIHYNCYIIYTYFIYAFATKGFKWAHSLRSSTSGEYMWVIFLSTFPSLSQHTTYIIWC